MNRKMILTAGPSITEREIQYVLDAVQHGWNENHSDYIHRFERAFADYVGTRFALSTSSCTGALHLSLLALGIGPGDEVLVPEISWAATASAVVYVGATPVFVDVDRATWCMAPDSAACAVTPRTKAIIPVHLYGHPTDMPEIINLARQHDLKILEDAAPALGAEVHGRKVGGLGDVAAFSFQGAKIMTCGEGGMLVTNDEAIYQRAAHLADHGRDKTRPFYITSVGYKYKLSNLQAAMGLAQLERIEELVERKRLIFNWYQKRLANLKGVALNVEQPWARNIYWMTSIVLDDSLNIKRDNVLAGLKQFGVDCRPFFPPISTFPMFVSCASQNPVAHDVSPRGINLPSGHNLTESDVDRVCEALINVLQVRRQAAA
jgi:perosamine synthetase